MKKTIFVLLLILCLLLIVSYNHLNTEKLDNLISISSFICTFATLIVTISLFDKYNAGSKIIDKNINIVIEYLEFLNSAKFTFIFFRNKDQKAESYAFGIMSFKNKINANEAMINYNAPLYYSLKSYFDFYHEINKFLDSNWLPKEIKTKSEFLKLPQIMKTYTLEQIKDSEFIVLNILPKEKDDCLVKISDNNTLNNFLENNLELRKCIKKWLKKQANDVSIDID